MSTKMSKTTILLSCSCLVDQTLSKITSQVGNGTSKIKLSPPIVLCDSDKVSLLMELNSNDIKLRISQILVPT